MVLFTKIVEVVLDADYNVLHFNTEFSSQILPEKMCKDSFFLNLFDECDKMNVRKIFTTKYTSVTVKTLTTSIQKGSFPTRVNYDWYVCTFNDDGTFVVNGRTNAPGETSEEYKELVDFFNKAPIALHWLDGDGKILWANDRELEVLGYDREEYIGENIMKFCPDSPEIVLNIFKQLSSGNSISDIPVRFRHKSGKIVDLLIDSNVNFNTDGTFNHTRCFIRDDTKRKIKEAKDVVLNEMSTKLATDKENFVAKLIHEIKTPLHVLTMMSNNETFDENVFVLQTNRMVCLIDNVIHAMNFEKGKIVHTSKKQFTLDTCLDEHIHFLRNIHEGIEIEVISDIENITVCCDANNLMHILSELVDNASKRGKYINISVIYNQESDSVTFSVIDFGDPISQDEVHKVFQNYWLSDITEDVSFENPGLGIGLNIAFNIVQCLGSMLQVESDNHCTCFEFELKVELSYSSSSDTETDRWESIDNSKVANKHVRVRNDPISNGFDEETGKYFKHILLVEDNTICQKVCKRLIVRQGHTCEVASNGKIAVEMIEKNSEMYDMIFMDIRMPIMDGMKASEKILKINEHIPIVALSAEESPSVREDILALGLVYFIEKPATSTLLIECIDKFAL